MKVLVIDNYDSFTYNLVAQLEKLGAKVKVIRNDKITPFEAMEYKHILLSPGPGIPEEAGNLKEIIRQCASTSSILGICLGHQAIAEVFGGKIAQLERVFHGVGSNIKIENKTGIFQGFDDQFMAARYHSWYVQDTPDDIEILATDESGINMAIKHKSFEVYGFQFHPESILTPQGDQLIKNWLQLNKGKQVHQFDYRALIKQS